MLASRLKTQKIILPESIMMLSRQLNKVKVVWITVALVFVTVWAIALMWTANILEQTALTKEHHELWHYDEIEKTASISIEQISDQNIAISREDIAIEIPGIELLIPSPIFDENPIQIVYTNTTIVSANNNENKSSSKGLVLLLHACSHSALKFFSPSQLSNCPNCVGLSEELRIVRLVMEQGYTPVAVSSINRKNGCWGSKDIPRIKAVLKHDRFQKYHQQDDGNHIFGIGASSGGAFAAELATKKIVQAALVMVMQLSDKVVNTLRTSISPIPIYLAPMPRDKNTMKRVMQNYRDLNIDSVKEYIVLDTTTCGSLPISAEYLVQRVPGITINAAEELIAKLKQAGHIDSSSNMLRVDPTRSDWRRIVSPNNSTHWLEKFDLKPGFSPLAKALHRGWAFHEYCSEAVVPALSFFEHHITSHYTQHSV